MQLWLTCQCGQTVGVDTSAAGSLAQCPACGLVLTVPKLPAGLPSELPSASPPAPPPALPYAPPPPLPLPPCPPPAVGKRMKGLAIASLVVGAVSCFACCMWCLGLPLGLTAIGLGIPALIGRTGGRGMGIAGVVLGGAGIVISLIPLGMVGMTGGLPGLGRGRPGRPPPPMPVARRSVPEPAPAPPVLSAQEVTDLLAAPVRRPRDEQRAAAELQRAVAAFGGRQKDAIALGACVEAFRLHLAHAGRDRLEDPARQQMFEQAQTELAGEVVTRYREADKLEQQRRWAEAERAYGRLSAILPDPEGEVRRNVDLHREYCRRRGSAGHVHAERGLREPTPPQVDDSGP